MLKKSSSFVLASFRGSTYGTEYAFASALAAASLDGHFEHPAGYVDSVCDLLTVESDGHQHSFSTTR
jgi:hypothetical protein